jgi:hypothetical protein
MRIAYGRMARRTTPAVGSGGNPAVDEPRTEAGRRLVAEQRDPCAIYTLDPGAEDWESWALREVLAIEAEAALPEPSLDDIAAEVAFAIVTDRQAFDHVERENRWTLPSALWESLDDGQREGWRQHRLVTLLSVRLVPSDREAE